MSEQKEIRGLRTSCPIYIYDEFCLSEEEQRYIINQFRQVGKTEILSSTAKEKINDR